MYRIRADHATKKADHLETNPPEVVKLRFMGGRHSQDRGDYGKWRISERYNLSSAEKFDTFEEAAAEFENRTGEKPPTPEWM